MKTNTAKAICVNCPVRENCLLYAIENDEIYGIWGGQTPRERVTIKKQWTMDGLI